MAETVGIKAFGAYLPRMRLKRAAAAAAHGWAFPALKGLAKGTRAFADWDEDSVTMGLEAARDALADRDRSAIDALFLASTTLPFVDRSNAGVVSLALDLPQSLRTLDVTGSLRAGTSALLTALSAGKPRGTLVVASDARKTKPASVQELRYGDAAAAVLVGSEDVVAVFRGAATLNADFVDHYRAEGQKHDYVWEERWIRDEGYMKLVPATVRRLFADTGVTAAAIDRLIVPVALPGVAEGVARTLGVRAEALAPQLVDDCGDAGAAYPLLLLVRELERALPGQKVVLVGFGNGCDALLFEATGRIGTVKPRRGVERAVKRGVEVADYLKFLSVKDEIDLDWGMRTEFTNKIALTTEYRHSREMLAFIGGRCTQTGTVQFPKSRVSVNSEVHAVDTQVDAPLADAPAHVVSFTADWLSYYPNPPFYFGLVQFENGARVSMEFTDVERSLLKIGAPVSMVFRVKELDRRRTYRHYFWKAVPSASEQ
jgi:3-hydroxy-3-methylglutaryl CoA synthase